MVDDDTVTVTGVEDKQGDAPVVPALSIAFHPSAAAVGRQLTIERGPITVGRGGSHFGAGGLDEERLSKEHFSVRRQGGDLLVEDLGSRNGTFVDDVRIERKVVGPGDVVEAGGLLFVVHRTLPGPPPRPHPTLIGNSLALRRVLNDVAAVAPRPTTTLLLGETGVGKELVAREIHQLSARSGRFVAVNCGGIADSVLQSELFGHVRGAFTGAAGPRPGLVEEARGGTLFLDEIGDASPALQVALLRLLQEHEFRPVGADRPVKADVRFVAATHRPLKGEILSGAFRRDLWARLSRWLVHIPPLRTRREDIGPLVRAFIARHGPELWLTRALMARLLRADWPGNARELDGVVERLCVGAESPVLDAPDWLDDVLESPLQDDDTVAEPMGTRDRSRRPHDRPEKEELERMFLACEGRMSELARRLGIGRKTAYRWMEDKGVDLDALRDRLGGPPGDDG